MPRIVHQWARATLGALLLASCLTGLVWAHPNIVRSDPPANAALTEAPRTLTVWFDEAIEPGYSSLALYNADGQRLDNFNTQYHPPSGADGPSLSLAVPPLPQGSYLVTWRILSAGDGHAVGGAFAFGVGVAPDIEAAATANAQANVETDFTTTLIRYFNLLGQAVFIGIVIFRAVVWHPARVGLDTALAHREQHRAFTVVADAVVGVLIIGTLGALYGQARATGVLFWELFGTRWGLVWLARLGLVLVIALNLESWLLAETKTQMRWALGCGLALLLTTSLVSHSSAKLGAWGAGMDYLHLLATSIWLGGLMALAITLWSVRGLDAGPRAALTANSLLHFSGLASGSVGLLLASGVGLSVTHISTWAGLMLTPYGQTLLGKLLLVALALAFGVYNSGIVRRVHPQRPALTVALEVLVVLAVFIGAALLADLIPATSATLTTPETNLSLNAASNGLVVAGEVRPARLGNNVFEIAVTAHGQAARGLTVQAVINPVGGGGLTGQLTLSETAPGKYTATAAPFQRAGDWQLLLSFESATTPITYVSFNLNIGPDAVIRLQDTAWPWPVRAVDWLNRFGRLFFIGAVLCVVAGWSWVVWRSGLLRFAPLGWLLAGLSLAAALWFAGAVWFRF